MAVEIIVALISGGAVVTAALITHIRVSKAKHELKQAELELGFQAEALTFPKFMTGLNGTQAELDKLFKETNIDRFLMLNAWNGRGNPKWTSAIYQQRASGQPYTDYKHVPIDDYYVQMLKATEMGGSQVYRADDFKGMIKDIYEDEGVKEAIWFFISGKKLPGTDSRAVVYCSFATHGDTPISDVEVTRCRMIVGRWRMLAEGFSGEDHDDD